MSGWKNSFIVFVLGFGLLSSVQCMGKPRGVSLEKASFYVGTEFRCLSDKSGKTIPMEHVNDDYCDCEDGSDEPGTSACSNGLFYCENKPYKGTYMMSSRVNDGICDCCDGSDEYDGTISCENTCEQLFAEIRAQQEAFRKKQEEGHKVKLEYIQQGHRIKEEKRSRMSELTKNKASLVEARDVLKAAKEEAEIPEKEAKDRHEEAWKAIKEERQKQLDAVAAAKAFGELDTNQDYVVDFPELMKHMEFDIDSDGTVSEDEAREYLEENEQTDLATFTEKIWPNIKEIFKSKEAEKESQEQQEGEAQTDEGAQTSEEIIAGEDATLPDLDSITEGGADTPIPDEEPDRYGDEDDEDENDDDEDDDLLEDDDDEDDDSDDEKERVNLRKRRERRKKHKSEDEEEKMPEYPEETKLLIQAADEARKQHDDAEDKVREAEKEITGIEEYLKMDFGPQEEYSALKGQCFEFTDREYTYRFCPFDKTSQKPKGGGIETNLGTWGHWYGPEEDKYDSQKYENGQGCWNGPNRSCHVNFHCGAENVLTGASEPSRCEYQFDFTTPARCSEPEPVPSHQVHEEL